MSAAPRLVSPVVPFKTTARRLHDRHRAHLQEGSGISSAIIAERGYFTVTSAAQISHMSDRQQRLVPAIGFPVYQLGEHYTDLTRPDNPQTDIREDGKVKTIKYEWPAHTPLVLDALPRYRDALQDPSIPLCITEGIKKTDAAASQSWGSNAVWISINGVWGWMEKDGKDVDGNRYLLPDYRKIPLRGRRVLLIPDSDYEVNPQVKMAFDEHAKALMARGATVCIVRFPHVDKKMGLDDAIVSGWTWEDIQMAIHPVEDVHTTEVDRLRYENERLRREKAQQAERMQWFLAALSNSTLGAGERITNVFLKSAIEANSSKADEQGAVPISIMGIGTESGQSPDSVGKHIAKMEKLGVLQRHYSTVLKHDARNGERKPITEVKVKLLPTFERPREIIAERNHGGRRYKKCESCGSENFVEKTTVVCEECGVIHGESKERPVSLAILQVAAQGTEEKLAVVARQNPSPNAVGLVPALADAASRKLRCLSKGGRLDNAPPVPVDPSVPQVAAQVKPKPASARPAPFAATDDDWRALQLLQANRYESEGRHDQAAYLRKIAGVAT